MLRRAVIHTFPSVIVLVAFLLRVYRLDAQSLWWDEGHSIAMASAPLAQIATQPGMDVHPPGYFLILHFWMGMVGMREYALRYLSVFFSVLTVALMLRLARTLSNVTAIGCGMLAALLPLHVAYAQEVRMYALVTCLTALSGYAQWRILFHDPSRRWWGLYVLATAANLYTHYFALFIIAFQGLVWVIWIIASRGDALQRLRRVWLTALAVVILFAPQWPLALQQTTAYANPNLRPPTWDEFLARSWRAYTVGLNIYPAWGYLEGIMAWLTVAAVGLWMWRGGMRAVQWGYWAGWLC
ncbi:MAG: glycosyltransferase family 39 protein, partial [Anaerolineae bacterium]|nr:glycosyltransferase family 39 protein [Anaerolineae bacterium]MDW8072424.1 glycosyltransferase family 39 protein [Anaerolineae bacterium]